MRRASSELRDAGKEGPANLIGGDFLYAVSDNGLPGSGADQAGFIDVLPELDTPPYPEEMRLKAQGFDVIKGL